MPTIEELHAERDTLTSEGEALLKIVDEGGELDAEQRKDLRAKSERLGKVKEEIAEAEGDEASLEGFRQAKEDAEARAKAAREKQKPPLYGSKKDDEKPQALKTPGQAFTESDGYRQMLKQYPEFRNWPSSAMSEPFEVPGGYDTLRASAMRTLVTSADTSAGDLVRADWRGLVEPGLVRPLTVVDLLTRLPTGSDAIEYAKEVSRVEGAAPVEEATALTGTSGTKPEGGIVFDMVRDTVKTIAEWVPATKRILSDADGLRRYIDAYVTYDLQRELEDQVLTGDGTGENFLGILEEPTILTEGAGDGPFYAIRGAITQIRVTGRAAPNAVVLNPTNAEEIDLAEINSETNHFVGPGPFAPGPRTIWGLTVVETDAMPEGTALVGDFRRAILFEREGISISVGTAGDDFIRNLVRILGELRAGFGVVRPKAFCAATV